MKRFHLWAWRFVPVVHPGMEMLVSHADGRFSRELEAHLSSCPECARKADLLRAAVERVSSPHGREKRRLLDDILKNIQVQIDAWRSLGRLPHAVLFEALEFYFGKEAARRIENCGGVSSTHGRLRPVTEPLFSTFLGRKGAEALAHQIAGAWM